MKKFIFSILMLFFCFSNASAAQKLPYCNAHHNEIVAIRFDAAEYIYQAHQDGGNLFRPSFAYTPLDAAFSSVKWEKTYTEFSEVFQDFMSYCQPAGLPALQLGKAKMTDQCFEMYNKCIEKHSNLSAHYERGRIYHPRRKTCPFMGEM